MKPAFLMFGKTRMPLAESSSVLASGVFWYRVLSAVSAARSSARATAGESRAAAVAMTTSRASSIIECRLISILHVATYDSPWSRQPVSAGSSARKCAKDASSSSVEAKRARRPLCVCSTRPSALSRVTSVFEVNWTTKARAYGSRLVMEGLSIARPEEQVPMEPGNFSEYSPRPTTAAPGQAALQGRHVEDVVSPRRHVEVEAS